MLAILTDEEDDNDMTNSLHLKMIGYIISQAVSSCPSIILFRKCGQL